MSRQSGTQSASGTISGVVRDPQGGVVTGAAVDIACGDERRHVTTSATGEFSESALPPVRCSVTARSESFEAETASVDARSGARATLVLQVRRFASEVVVTPSRGIDESTFNVPEALSVTSRRDIDTRPYTLLPQVLREEPGVVLQQTSSAHTSPVIRGFTGQSNVYLLDGVRLNNSSWRTGNSQYLAWVDPGPIGSIEIVRGGGSVQYGSDALGGTVQFLSPPSMLGIPRAHVGGTLEVSGASADESVAGRGELTLQAGSASVTIGGSRQHVNDRRAGEGIDSHSAVTRFLGLPSSILGSRLRATSFGQGGVYALGAFNPGTATARVLYMHESIANSSRYDRLLGGEGLFRSGFDPQTLDFGMARYSRPDVGGFDGISATISLNRQADGRFEQARPTLRLDRQEATTTALGYQIQAHRDFASRHQFVVGAEVYDESIGAMRQLVEPTGIITAARPDIPNGTSYTTFGAFAQQSVDLVPNRLSVRGGVRYSSFGFATTADSALGVIDEDVTMRSMTFQTAAVVSLTDHLNLTANVTRGFRAPNASDFGSIGLTGGGGFEIAPSRAVSLGALVGSTAAANAASTGERVTGLRPEVAYQYEVGLKARTRRVSGSMNAFDMELFDFIQRRALVFNTSVVGTTISGFEVVRQDAAGLAYIAQDVRPIATRVNVDRARVHGFDAEGEVGISSSWTANAYFSVTKGRLLPAGESLPRMPPAMGGARLRWNSERVWAEGVVSVAAARTRLNSADLSNARIGAVRTRTSIANFFNGTATDMGLVRDGILVETGESLAHVQSRVLGTASSGSLYTTQPGFVVVGLRGGLRITPQFDVTVIGENLGDVNYRLLDSGLDATGFNLQVRTRYRF